MESNKYVIARIGSEKYGINITEVQTIEKFMVICRVPRSKTHMRGVVNLRGEIIPIIDAKTKFELGQTEGNDESRIIIIANDEGKTGLLVEGVNEVEEIDKDNLENVRELTIGDETKKFVSAVGKINDGEDIILILDLEEMFKDQ
ncbi:MAG: chemotaxis protein CheW [Tissierellales bacterium]|jgi:purine-binding chemotaxis protein CheW|nr:chemotaxis protein CheW [Tissierellales bacterium]